MMLLAAAALLVGIESPPTTPANLTAVQGPCACVDLRWSPSVDDHDDLLRYDIERDGTVVLMFVSNVHDHPITVRDQPVETGSHSYRIRAVDLDGAASPYSPATPVVVVSGCA